MKSFIFKYIDVDDLDQVMQEIKQFHAFKRFPVPNFFSMKPEEVMPHLPTLEKWFNKHNMETNLIAHIGQPPNSIQAVHIDSGPLSIALNFPIDIVSECSTLFFENKGEIVENYTPVTNIKYLTYVDPDPVVIGEYVLTHPTLLNIKLPHSIRNKSATETRYCFSFRFKQDPWHLIK